MWGDWLCKGVIFLKVHYFQRYQAKENVTTANTLLLLERFYQYSPDNFFRFLKSEYFSEQFDPEIAFVLQEKNAESVADAAIIQESFKIVIETKLTDWFSADQLMRHLQAFRNQEYKFLFTIASEPMDDRKKADVDKQIAVYNEKHNLHITHINTTFEFLADAIQRNIDERDLQMMDILNDYREYCVHDNLIPVNDSWKFMRVQLAGTTFNFNVKANLYYDNIERGFRAHDYLGLYKEKSVRAIGRLSARILAVETDKGMEYESEMGEITEERKQSILSAIKDAEQYGYDLRHNKHRYFFVEKFYETDFRKITPRAPRGSRIFNLTELLGKELLENEKLPDTAKIAELLKEKTWS